MNSNSACQNEVFPGLPYEPGRQPSRPLRICIASYDFVGPVRNGGVGTAFTSLGDALAKAGHEVTMLYVSGNFCENITMNHWIAEYRKKGIHFVPMPDVVGFKLAASFHMARSYMVYEYLRRQSFDVIHFSEWRAPGYFSIVAKRQGLAFQNTVLGVNTHGPTLWSLIGNGEYLTQVADVELDFMERQSVKLADVVISPSHYLFRWMREQHWELSENCYVHQNVVPVNAQGGTRTASEARHPVKELVFFGRLEVRKGIVLLCDALDRLAHDPSVSNLKITFLGKLSKINDQDSLTYLKQRSLKWPWEWETINNLDQRGAMNYLQSEGRLALIPSLCDNLPYTVMECLGAGICFLASDIGGIPEMVAPEDRAEILFPLRPAAFADKIRQALRDGVRPARFAVEPEATERGWLDWHAGLASTGLNLSVSTDLLATPPLVSVCISHFNRPAYLRQALASLEQQDYSNFEVVLVDDASTSPEAIGYINSLEPEFTRRGWQLIRNPEELFVGAARNVAARHARGEYVMFMDDDNLAKPNELTTFMNVAGKTNADIVSCCLDFFSTKEPPRFGQAPEQRFLFLGPAVSASALRNYLGDTNSLFRREVFLKLGGFHEERSVGHEDWELIGKAILKGYHHEVVPEALVWYRRTDDGNSATTNNSLQRGHMRNISPYLEAVPPALRALILFAQGQAIHGNAGSDKAQQAVYLKQSARWRGLFEAARVLKSSQQRQAGHKMLKDALLAAKATNHPLVMLEALLAIGAEMRETHMDEARQVLQLAVQLARTLKRTADADHAEGLLAACAKGRSRPLAPTKAAAPTAVQSGSKAPEVSIVILTFNNLEFTRRCLDSVACSKSATPYEVIVVDNASEDGTLEFLREQEAAGRIRLIANPRNEGFARGCNIGAQAARGSLLLFLNNDTQVTAGWLDALIQAARKPGVGIAGAKLLYPDGRVQHAGIEFVNGVPDHPNRFARSDTPKVNQFRELDMVTGACLMMPRDLFEQLAGFDEAYRNGVEDIDLCLRVRAAGRKVVYEPKCVVYHPEGQSAGRFNHVRDNLKLFFSRWGKNFDAEHRFKLPQPARTIRASQSVLLATPATASITDRPVLVAWDGSFLDFGSLSHVNRSLTAPLARRSEVELTLLGDPAALNGKGSCPELAALAPQLRKEAPAETQVTVRHAWPPNWRRPRQGRLVVIQPWEFGTLPADWVKQARDVDEFWVPSEFVRRCYVDSGVDAAKVSVVPNGIDPGQFRPEAPARPLATKKKFKFLFVGGTIGRKGPDVLLKSYLKSFTAADDVCLVIKDFGGQSVYKGMTFAEQIKAVQAQPNAPEILYLDSELASEELPGLYTACDCLVHPYRGEGFGLPVLEAMACGLPVIVTGGGAADDFANDEIAYRLPSVRRMIGHEVGGMKLVSEAWLLEPDGDALVERMKWVVANANAAQAKGRLASERVRQDWTWERAAAVAAERLQALAQTGEKTSAASAPAKPAPVKSAPTTLPACARLGSLDQARTRFGQRDFAGAWEAGVAAIQARPFHPEAYLLLAEIALGVGDGASARKCAQRAREFAPAWKAPKQFLKKADGGKRKIEDDALASRINADTTRLCQGAARLTVCVVARNEEKFLGQCLKSVKGIADQIVVLDTGSTDRTVEIAKEHGAEVHHFEWCDDFSAARNAALEHITGDWVLMLDADEELPADQHDRLRAELKQSGALAYRTPLVNQGEEAQGQSYVPRLYRNVPGAYYYGRIHEQVFPSLIPFCKAWGLETRLGTAQLLHHGYSKELVRDRNKIERNLKLLHQAIAERPADTNLQMNLGLELVRSGEVETGLNHYREAFRLMSAQPSNEVVPELREVLLTQLTSHLYKVRAHDEIVQTLTSPLAKTGGLTASLHFAFALALFELKQYREAAEQVRQCLTKRNQKTFAPINTDIHTAAPHHCLALSLARLGDTAEAEKAFQAGFAVKNAKDDLKLDYAKFLVSQNRPVEALHQLHEIVQLNARNAVAWRLGGEIGLSQPAFLEFGRDWTGEALRCLPDDPIVIAQRAEALLMSQETKEALPLWERACNGERPPRAQAALIICGSVNSRPVEGPRTSAEEVAVSRAFLDWYRRLVTAGARDTIVSLNAKVEALRPVLPSAAHILESVVAEAERGEAVAAGAM